jgi:hypothetical protein
MVDRVDKGWLAAISFKFQVPGLHISRFLLQGFYFKAFTSRLLLQAFYFKAFTSRLLLQAFYFKPFTSSLLLQAFYFKPRYYWQPLTGNPIPVCPCQPTNLSTCIPFSTFITLVN